jgi:tetratricopeptide (TPR) repeat protein
MKAVLCFLLGLASFVRGGDYRKDFTELKAKVGEEKLEAHLADWRKREPDNSSAWILSAHFAADQTGPIALLGNEGQLPAGRYTLETKGDKIVVLDKDGKPAGEVANAKNPAGPIIAAGFLEEAVKRWPRRLDIHFGLATMYAEAGLWKEHVATLQKAGAIARENAGQLKWCHDEDLPKAEPVFLADTLHSFAMKQFRQETDEGDARFFAIAQLLVETCPKSPKGYNDVAIYHGLKKDWKAVQPMLEKAAEVGPDDALVWFNLGENSERLGKKDTARQAYQHVIELKPEEKLLAAAKKKLGALGKAKK